MKSKHLKQSDGFSHAVDLAPLVNGDIPWEDFSQFNLVADAMFQAADELDVPLEWGGHWRTFVDGPHFQIRV